MENDDILNDLEIYNYEVGTIINENRSICLLTNDLSEANKKYEDEVNKINKDDKSHYIVYLFDYNKTTNINYYDNIEEDV